MWRASRWCIQWIIALTLCWTASAAWGQAPPPRGGSQPAETQTPTTEPPLVAPTLVRPMAAYPLELLGLLAPGQQKGPVTLTPSLGISEEYNDNVFADNQNRQWDFITTFSPTITLAIQQPSYQLNAGYSFSATIYAVEPNLSNAFDSQSFIAQGFYKVTPALTLSASESFLLSNYTNLVSTQGGFSTGRQKSWNNSFSPSLAWQMTPRNSLTLGVSYNALRYEGGGQGIDSDTYTFQSTVSHVFTPRFTGNIAYSFAYLDSRGEDSATSHSPTVGFSYQLTPTLIAAVNGGAAFTTTGGDTFVSPSGNISLTQFFRIGSASAQYSRGVGVAGGFGGTTDTQTASATLVLSSLARGLLVAFSPSYSTADSLSSRQSNQVDVKTFTLTLDATYQLSRYANLFAGYTFLHQRTGGSSTTQVDVDQNRVRVGVQFGYPFTFN